MNAVIDRTFMEFEEIYNNRKQYNLEWAYQDAQNKLDQYKNKVIEGKMKDKCKLCNGYFDEKLKKLKDENLRTLKKHKWYAGIFANIYSLVSMLEIALSVALVMVITNLSHAGEEMMHWEAFGFWIGLTFAFLKVIIEKRFLKPYIEKLGWELYRKSYRTIKEYSEVVNKQLVQYMVYNRKDEPRQVA